jgi:hypothetical protein
VATLPTVCHAQVQDHPYGIADIRVGGHQLGEIL